MARPRKNNAEYFSHDSQMRNNVKVKAIRQKHGIAGYAAFCMLLEALTDSDNYKITVDELTIDLMAGDFGLPCEELESMLQSFSRLKLIVYDKESIFAPALIRRMEPLTEKRERKRLWADRNKHVLAVKNSKEDAFKPSKNPQSKDKGKVKLTKVSSNKKTPPSLSDFILPDSLDTEKFRSEFSILLSEPKWKRKTPTAIQKSIDALSEFDVEFATAQVVRAISANWQGIVFEDTPARYSDWLNGKKGGGSSPSRPSCAGRATLNGIGANPDAYNKKQAF